MAGERGKGGLYISKGPMELLFWFTVFYSHLLYRSESYVLELVRIIDFFCFLADYSVARRFSPHAGFFPCTVKGIYLVRNRREG